MPKTEPTQRKTCHQCGRTEIHPENWDKEFDICDFCANEILHQSVQEYGDLDHIDNPYEKEMVGKPINQAPFETEEMLMSKETLAHYRQERRKDKRRDKERKIWLGQQKGKEYDLPKKPETPKEYTLLSLSSPILSDIEQAIAPSILALKQAMDQQREKIENETGIDPLSLTEDEKKQKLDG